MLPLDQDLERRRTVWKALSALFLDTELDENAYREMARALSASKYTEREIQVILWDEVFPVLEANLRDLAGVWEGFDLDWLQERIVASPRRRSVWARLMGRLPLGPASIVRKEWAKLAPFLAASMTRNFR